MTKSLTFIAYFLGTVVFCIAGAAGGTGVGFIIRGEYNTSILGYTAIGFLVGTGLYVLHRFIAAKIDQRFYWYRKRGEQVGSLAFLALFIILLVRFGN
jgi:hypothetical protein